MAGFQIPNYGYNSNTPMMDFGKQGASNPTGSYFQAAQANTSDAWNIPGGLDYRSVSAPQLKTPGSSNNGSGNSTGLGWNVGTGQLALGGLQTLGNLWQAWESNKLAKEQFAFQKDVTDTNLANQIQSYNTTLEDRTRTRGQIEGGSAQDAQAYIDKNKLRRQN